MTGISVQLQLSSKGSPCCQIIICSSSKNSSHQDQVARLRCSKGKRPTSVWSLESPGLHVNAQSSQKSSRQARRDGVEVESPFVERVRAGSCQSNSGVTLLLLAVVHIWSLTPPLIVSPSCLSQPPRGLYFPPLFSVSLHPSFSVHLLWHNAEHECGFVCVHTTLHTTRQNIVRKWRQQQQLPVTCQVRCYSSVWPALYLVQQCEIKIIQNTLKVVHPFHPIC